MEPSTPDLQGSPQPAPDARRMADSRSSSNRQQVFIFVCVHPIPVLQDVRRRNGVLRLETTTNSTDDLHWCQSQIAKDKWTIQSIALQSYNDSLCLSFVINNFRAVHKTAVIKCQKKDS